MIGTTLAHYRITAAIGAGGMGEVYRATDTKLGRDVAIKLLPAELAQDPERLARFEREAKLLASLNHTNIAHVYGFESATLSDGSSAHFLAMELVEGEDLAERLKRGAIPVDEAIAIAKQIAEALEEAHDKGIVHRDLKPANVKLTPDGKVKVLDFGLAKAWEGPGAASSDLSQSPTLAHTGTAAGLILGTAAYMSPEQARGKTVDKRADIWAFGVVVFEMLTGRQLFGGETVSDVLAAVLTREFEWGALPSALPAAARDTLRRCLERDPRQRLRDIGDVRLEGGQGEVVLASAPARWPWLWPLLGVLAGALVFGVLWLRGDSAGRRLERFAIPLPAGFEIDVTFNGLALAPDGTLLAYPADDGSGVTRLYVHRIGELDPIPLPGTEDARYPFFSPDGLQIGFFARQMLKRTSVSGGAVQTVCAAAAGRGGSWGPDNRIVFSAGGLSGRGVLHQVPARGGEPTTLTRFLAERQEFSHRWPWFLPDGKHVLFVAQTGQGSTKGGQSVIEVLDLDSKERRPLIRANSSVEFVPPDHLLYWNEGAALARRFDPRTLQVSGDPVPLADGVGYGALEFGAFVASASGTLVYQKGEAESSRLELFASDGRRLETITDATGTTVSPRLSPEGSRIAYVRDGDIWVRDLDRGTATRLTFEPGNEEDPAWSPDGQWIAFVASDGGFSIRRKRASGIGEAERVYAADPKTTALFLSDWSADGQSLLIVIDHPEHPMDVGKIDVRDGSLEILVATPFAETAPSLSPDGGWLLTTSDATGRMEVYVYGLRQTGGRWQISRDGGGAPRWSRDGRKLYYVQGDWTTASELVSVAVQPGEPFRIGTPAKIMSVERARGHWAPFDVSPDGTRIVWNARVGGIRGPRPLALVRNWQRLLAAGVETGTR